MRDRSDQTTDRQITTAPCGHILTNAGVWSPDGNSIVYDTRSDPAGAVFDSRSIQVVEIHTGNVRQIYTAGPCGVATFDPRTGRVVFIRGPAEPSPNWSYSATHREGVLVDPARPNVIENLDARNVIPPFTPGALRGGTHLHVFSADGLFVSFTYEDAVLERLEPGAKDSDRNARGVGVTQTGRPVAVPSGSQNLDGIGFSVLLTNLTDRPEPGSDQISRAFEEAWVGDHGYVRADGSRKTHAIAFQGRVHECDEVFIVDLPEDLTRPGDGPLQGTAIRRPLPPAGTRQRRLTYTGHRKHPGIQGPRHWLRSSPDGSAIGFLMRDQSGVIQFCTVSPDGGPIRQVTAGPHGIDSAFTWSPDGRHVAAVVDGSVVTIAVADGTLDRLTRPSPAESSPRPEACVFSPDGSRVAYIRRVPVDGTRYNQIFVVTMPRGREVV